MNFDVLWSNFLSEIKKEISSISYDTWFSETKLHDLKDDQAIVIVPMDIHKTHLNNKYLDLMKDVFSSVSKINDINFEFILEDELEVFQKEPEFISENIKLDEVSDPYVNSNLNKKYTFDNFIVGESNRFAQAASLLVSEQPGKLYNPLFIYGNSGLGKTHLMHAIGNYIVNNSNSKVLYVTSEQFINDFLGINRTDETGTNYNYIDHFKNKYRNIDVLIIDDIQYLGTAIKTQQEFFHTFNSLHRENKQIIISSDRSPEDLKILEERLRTRFCWGLTADIYPPDFELRKNILKKKIIGGNVEKNIPDDVIEYIATNLGSDVRQLEGSINRLLAYSTIMGGSEINLELAVEALKDFLNKGISEKNDVRKIQKIVSEYFQISIEDLKSKKRSSNIAFPRQIAMYLCRKYTSESFPKIGIEFGGKDHSTVMHSCDKIELEMKENKEIYNTIEKLKNLVR